MDALVSQLFAGLSLGSVLLLAALGLALTFGQMGVINMAHGEFMMAGAYTAFVVQGVIADAGVSLLVSLVIGFLVGGLLGLLLEITLISRMYKRPLDTLLVTFGVALVLQQLARDVFGAPNVDVRAPAFLSGAVQILGVGIPKTRLFILALALAVRAGALPPAQAHPARPAHPGHRAEPGPGRDVGHLDARHRPAHVLRRLRRRRGRRAWR